MSSEDATTKPTIETVLERINGLEQRISERIDALEERLDSRLDRIESVANMTRSEMLDLRADFRDWRKQLREKIPTLS